MRDIRMKTCSAQSQHDYGIGTDYLMFWNRIKYQAIESMPALK